MNKHEQKTLFEETQVVGATRWLKLETLTYVNRQGKQLKWDRCVRSTKVSEDSTDAVSILTILKNHAKGEDHVVLVKQFRPPVNKYAVELPAGLVDKSETLEQAAIRELKEETGYIGKVTSVSPSLCMSPGLTNESIALVVVEVDMKLPENINPKQNLDTNEDIEVFTLPLRNLVNSLKEMTKTDNIFVFTGLYYLAQGFAIASPNPTTPRQGLTTRIRDSLRNSMSSITGSKTSS